MNVVGHNYEFVQDDIFIMIWQIIPAMQNNFSNFIQQHFAVYDFTKKIFAVVCNNGDKICAILRIIIAW